MAKPLATSFARNGPVSVLMMVSKRVVIALAALFITRGKTHAVRPANVAFGLIVTWNFTITGRLAWPREDLRL